MTDKLCNASEPGTTISPLLSAVANGGNIDSMQQEMQRESAKNRGGNGCIILSLNSSIRAEARNVIIM
jgi:hypothetical protein